MSLLTPTRRAPSSPPLDEDSHLPVLSSWQDIVSAIKLKFEGDMLPPSPQDDSKLHQEEEDLVFPLPLFPTLQESFGFLQEDSGTLPNRELQTQPFFPREYFLRLNH